MLERIDGLVSENRLDSELQWMLPAYGTITVIYFGSQEGLPSLKRWLREHASTAFPERHARDASLSGRGQMSDY